MMEEEICPRCNKKISADEYIDNGGYCKDCIEIIEREIVSSETKSIKKNQSRNQRRSICFLLQY